MIQDTEMLILRFQEAKSEAYNWG